MGTSTSRRSTSARPVASVSRVAVTPPSTEFSIGTTAKSARSARTVSSAETTSICGRYCASSGPATCRSAASVNVPAGPR
jgi:hypothetical protein